MRIVLKMVSLMLRSIDIISCESFTALRLFLNADTTLCHQLVMQILTNLWAIQKWMRSQKNFQLFSSSILIIYDARRLRQMIDLQNQKRDGFLNGDSSPGSLTGELFPPQFNRNCGTFGSLTQDVGSSPPSPTSLSYRKKQRSHSSINNYEQVRIHSQIKPLASNHLLSANEKDAQQLRHDAGQLIRCI